MEGVSDFGFWVEDRVSPKGNRMMRRALALRLVPVLPNAAVNKSLQAS